MAKRNKLTRLERARQFAPFDALKGLHDAIALKEYEHDQIEKGILSEDKIIEISNILFNLTEETTLLVTYYRDGHYLNETGKVKLDVLNSQLIINKKEIILDDIHDIKVIDN